MKHILFDLFLVSLGAGIGVVSMCLIQAGKAAENAVNVHISRLRTKIEDNPRDPQYIITVWGIGYKLGDFKE